MQIAIWRGVWGQNAPNTAPVLDLGLCALLEAPKFRHSGAPNGVSIDRLESSSSFNHILDWTWGEGMPSRLRWDMAFELGRTG